MKNIDHVFSMFIFETTHKKLVFYMNYVIINNKHNETKFKYIEKAKDMKMEI